MCFFFNENVSKEIKALLQGRATRLITFFYLFGIFELSPWGDEWVGEWRGGMWTLWLP